MGKDDDAPGGRGRVVFRGVHDPAAAAAAATATVAELLLAVVAFMDVSEDQAGTGGRLGLGETINLLAGWGLAWVYEGDGVHSGC